MKGSVMNIPFSVVVIVVLSSSLCAIGNKQYQQFLECLLDYNESITKVVYTSNNSSYSSVLNYTIRNQRFSTPQTPKPLIIIKPSHVSHIQAAVICSKSHDLQIRIRSGGHDYEGLSYVAHVPFVVVDLIDLNTVTVDAEKSAAWVQSGASLGELYDKIAEKSRTLAFPAGGCPTVGVGGHFSGGGYGFLMRKYGLAADNVIDATLVDANGKFHDRESMGEDLFWAIRGSGGGSFGIVVAWKVKLVPVPAIVTVCSTGKTLEDGATKLIHQWQYVANKLDENLFLAIIWTGGNTSSKREGSINPVALFFSLFLGRSNEGMAIMNTAFPELGLTKEDCIETSWIQNGQALGTLLTRSASLPPLNSGSNKIKSDYVKEPMTEDAIQGIGKRLRFSEDIEAVQIVMVPYGGRMSEISESAIPFSHRAGILYQIGYYIGWQEQGVEAESRHLNWTRELYSYMTHFVSKSPRKAYANYRDLDIGSNNKNGTTSYKEAMIWGLNYFGRNNFNRLVYVKTKVDPHNFFSHQQSIPILKTTLEFTETEFNILDSMNVYSNDASTSYCAAK